MMVVDRDRGDCIDINIITTINTTTTIIITIMTTTLSQKDSRASA